MAEKRKEMNPDVKNIVVSIRNEEFTLQHIADTLNIHRGTVSNVTVTFEKRGSTENKPWRGRPQILDPRDERSLVRLVRTNHKVPLGDWTNRYNRHRPRQVSQWTAQRCLYWQGYYRRVVKKEVRVREVNRKKRLKPSLPSACLPQLNQRSVLWFGGA